MNKAIWDAYESSRPIQQNKRCRDATWWNDRLSMFDPIREGLSIRPSVPEEVRLHKVLAKGRVDTGMARRK